MAKQMVKQMKDRIRNRRPSAPRPNPQTVPKPPAPAAAATGLVLALAVALAVDGWIAAWLAPTPALAAPASAAGLSVLSGATLVRDHPANDGDSFYIKANGRELHLRLYYVDCPETRLGRPARSMIKRMWYQARYFGLQDPGPVMRFGNEAKRYTERVLAEPFTVYTEYERVMSGKRVYGFVKTGGGEYLSQLLVGQGLARIYGRPRQNPDGLSEDAVLERLRGLEAAAQRARLGVWKDSDFERVARARERQGREDRELAEFAAKLKERRPSHRSPDAAPLDLNRASRAQLESIKGIGPTLAERIIAARPYRSTEELLEVRGIGPATLRKIRPHLVVN